MQRYQRQMRFHPFGENGQNALTRANILILGAGALGSHVVEQLARMGAHHLTIVDMDIVEESNLHRQALYTEDDAVNMTPKVYAVKDKIAHINSNVDVQTYYQEIDSTNIEDLLRDVNPDIVIDGMDHFKIRYLINEACHKHNIPWVYGAAVGSKGTVYGIDFSGPCLKCLLKRMPSSGESCAINGVLPPVISQVASYEVSEAVRYLSGHGFSKKLITINAFDIDYKAMNVDILKDDTCEVCAKHHYTLLETKQQQQIESLCGKTYLFRYDASVFEHADYFPGDIVKSTSFAKLIKDDDYEITLFKDGRMNVYGVEDDDEANKLYHYYLKAIK
ncbi:ThiF family adenylyltransferase [Staphylococcus devriesei]|uniref:Thiamine/molybdopterin biosynthesis protein n=1 Tax=Staphylococcus devriesei TaxID=586733 RepID=A0A2T4KR06_9STAP|nr:ThiF family adenylyltransferase [Staphylococcus devriesei]MCE5090257.1 ThiF family adenylyltransferase [Staphylococcus devriesei]PTF04829.1 thiamine/molybdopterin biosynthesis protein [Staphylococcus devriesei]PTF15821.1 thiamine/molybdopterin biosynthesis protein [Staphylococcus devriesei]